MQAHAHTYTYAYISAHVHRPSSFYRDIRLHTHVHTHACTRNRSCVRAHAVAQRHPPVLPARTRGAWHPPAAASSWRQWTSHSIIPVRSSLPPDDSLSRAQTPGTPAHTHTQGAITPRTSRGVVQGRNHLTLARAHTGREQGASTDHPCTRMQGAMRRANTRG